MRDLISFLIDLFSFDKEHPLLFTQFNFWAFFLLVFAGFCLIMAVVKITLYIISIVG